MLKKILAKPSTKWTFISSILFFIFLFFTPLTFYNSFGVWLVFFEAILCGFLVFMTTAKLGSFQDLLYINEKKDESTEQTSVIIIPFVVAVVLLIVLINGFNYRINSRLEKEGIITKAVILDGTRTVSGGLRRKRESNELSVQFETRDGKLNTYKTEISKEIFQSVSRGLEVELKYLPETPEIFKLIVGNENVRKIKGIPNRELKFTDLDTLITMNSQQIGEYLKTISEGWNYSEDEEGSVYENSLKKELVGISKTGRLLVKGTIAALPEYTIPKERILSERKDIQKNVNGFLMLTTKTFELKTMEIMQVMAISGKGSVDISLVLVKK